MSGWSAAAAGAMAIGSSALDYDLNRRMMKKEVDYSAKVSNHYAREQRQTAYQDTTHDMRAAGINPILAYRSGPSNIGSVSISRQNPVPYAGNAVNTFNAISNSAKDRQTKTEQQKLMKQQEAQARTQALKNAADYSILQHVEEQEAIRTSNAALDLKVKKSFLDSVLNKAKVQGDDGIKALEPLRQLREIIFGGHNPMSLFK